MKRNIDFPGGWIPDEEEACPARQEEDVSGMVRNGMELRRLNRNRIFRAVYESGRVSQQELASAIGASRVQVARVCEQLKRARIVDIKKRRLYILKLDELAEMTSLEVPSYR